MLKKTASQLFGLFSVQSGEEDEILMKALQADDIRAFEKLYHKYKDPIFNYYLSNTRSKSVAEENLQDLFLKLFEKKESFKFQSKFSTWLWTMARNQLIDQTRLSETKLENQSESLDSQAFDQLDSELAEADILLIKKVEEHQVKMCIDELKDTQKEVLSLRVFSDLGYEEIAQICKLSLSSVKSLLVRAKEKLLSCFKRGHLHE